MRKSTRVALIVTGIVAALAVSGAGIGYVVADAAEPAATENPSSIECANIERAYNAWNSSLRLRTAYQFTYANEVELATEMDDQKALYQAVSGYDDQPSKVLATAIATFGADLAVLNAQLVIADDIDPGQADRVAKSRAKVIQDYQAWKAATCG